MRLIILWLLKYPPQPNQVKELEDIFGDIKIKHVPTIIGDSSEVIDLMEKHFANHVVATLPIQVIADLTLLGIYPICPSWRKELNDAGETIFIHDHFDQVKGVEIVSCPINHRMYGWNRSEANK